VKSNFKMKLLLLLSLLAVALAVKVDPSKTLIWGPGLTDDANLPVRYFYIQAMDRHSNPITKDLGKEAFSFTVKSPGSVRVRVWTQMLNLQNGKYIARFRAYGYGGSLSIAVTHKDKHIPGSPFYVGEMSSDDCYCPLPMNKWMNALECPRSFPQIKIDLQPHRVIQLEGLRAKMLERFRRVSFCHYAIKNNEIFRECHGRTTDFKIFTDEILLSLSKKTTLPDMELFWNLGDWPLEVHKDDPLPMISWCGSQETQDIILPTYDLTGSVLNMMGRVSLDVFSVQAHEAPLWEDKVPKALFRGRDSRRERLNLCEISQNNSELVDAAITNYFFFRADEKKHGKKVKPISFMKFFDNKYQLNVDGTVAAYRFPYLMLGTSVVMKQNSDYYEHFYRQMKPHVHYIPIKHSLADVVEKVGWARNHDDEVRKIQKAGMKKAREILTPVNILCYHAVAFNEMAARQNGTVTVLESMEKVNHKENKPNCNCRLDRKKIKKDEL